MIQTLKKKLKKIINKTPYKPLKKSLVKLKLKKQFKNSQKSLKKTHFFSQPQLEKINFLKLIQNLNNDFQLKATDKQDHIKFPVRVFFNHIPVRIKNKLNAISFKTQNLTSRQKFLKRLRQEKKSKLSSFFYRPWKKVKLAPTKKQQWLNSAYLQYKYLRFKDRKDFFRGYLGRIILLTELHSNNDYKASWFSRYYFLWKNRDLKKTHPELFYQLEKTYSRSFCKTQKLQTKWVSLQKQGWWYENLVQKKKLPKSIKKFVLDRPHTAFRIHWKQQKREPWKNALLFKRAVYAGFAEDRRKENKFNLLKIRPYLRRKNPRFEKRNRIYHRWTLLLANRRQKFRIKADKIARIKQITSQVLFPFYGNLRWNQRRQILNKSRLIKSKHLSSNEIILSHLENRLDVVIYRLNLAPTILWARRLIAEGSIFVSPQNLYQTELKWNAMYASLKKFAFPLKLRDPKNLYVSSLLKDLPHHWGSFKFLGRPQTNVSYLLQPGDLIQCSLDNSLNQFKTHSSLWQKPFPSHFLTAKKKVFLWEWLSQKYVNKTFLNWDQTSEKVNAAIFLHAPRFTDLHSTDRVKESFLRWAVM